MAESASTAARDNADWGRTVEQVACERWPLDHVAGDTDAPNWYDAMTTAPITTGPNARWWIRRSSHDQLVAAGGEYALGVYEPGAGVRRLALVPAHAVDRALIRTWSPCGREHHADEAARVPWTRLFDALEDGDGS